MSTRWKYTVPMGDILNNEALEWEVRRDAAVERLRAANLPDPEEELEWILDDLSMAPDPNAVENEWWRLYNWADANRVWIDPINPD